MTGNEDFLTASLHHGNLQVDTSDLNPRPMIAVLDAKPGLADAFRERIVELVRQVAANRAAPPSRPTRPATPPDASTSTRSTPTPLRSTHT